MRINVKIGLVILSLTVFLLFTNSSYSKDNSINLSELTLKQAQELMQMGKLTSVELVDYYLDRIERYDQNGVKLFSVAQINPKAIEIAKALDAERSQNKLRGLLHGIPILLKDNIDTSDGMANTAGSLALKNNYPKDDAFLVQNLREAGAIILGKTNLSEWANFRSTKSSSGWSANWGQAKNPYNIKKSPCGSSSGSGVSVAANLTLLAIGTETDGSVTCPAAMNGIVGIKPSVGTVSRDGIIPISHTQDTAGPMARTVADAVVLLQAMVKVDKNDSLHQKGLNNYSQHLKVDGLKGKRIGIVRNLMDYDHSFDKAFDLAVKVLQENGAIIVDNTNLPNLDKVYKSELTVLLHEFKQGINQYLSNAATGLTLSHLIEFNQQNAAKEMQYFAQELFVMANSSGGLNDKQYLKAKQQAKLLAGKEGIDAILAKHDLDLLVAPTTSKAWDINLESGDKFLGSATSPAAVAGYPHITVPMGFIDGLPVGISFFGTNLSEGLLIEVAYGYEQATKHRKAPRL